MFWINHHHPQHWLDGFVELVVVVVDWLIVSIITLQWLWGLIWWPIRRLWRVRGIIIKLVIDWFIRSLSEIGDGFLCFNIGSKQFERFGKWPSRKQETRTRPRSRVQLDIFQHCSWNSLEHSPWAWHSLRPSRWPPSSFEFWPFWLSCLPCVDFVRAIQVWIWITIWSRFGKVTTIRWFGRQWVCIEWNARSVKCISFLYLLRPAGWWLLLVAANGRLAFNAYVSIGRFDSAG